MEQYLATSYRPDCDYVDGVVEERNLGEKEHALLQSALNYLFRHNRSSWNIEAYPKLRVQVTPTRFRIPDITVVQTGKWERILRTPPLLTIEILSPEDSLSSIRRRVDDYLRFGTEHVWIIDADLRKAYVCSLHGFEEPADGVLTIPGSSIRVVLGDLFAELERG